jgi:hypothetical protein
MVNYSVRHEAAHAESNHVKNSENVRFHEERTNVYIVLLVAV